MAKVATQRGTAQKQPGIAIDAAGGAVIDPTKNVLDLVDMSVVRLNDLRDASQQLTDAKLAHIKEVVELRAECAKETRNADGKIAEMREEYSKRVRELDADRLEKIRQVDVLAGNTAADRALVAIQTLATTTSQNAETLRSMVSQNASTLAAQLDQRMAAVTERIAAVEKSIYTGQGRAAVSDPAMVEMVGEIKRMALLQTANAGQGAGKTAMWGYVVGALGLVLTLLAIGTALLNLRGA